MYASLGLTASLEGLKVSENQMVSRSQEEKKVSRSQKKKTVSEFMHLWVDGELFFYFSSFFYLSSCLCMHLWG
jgi:hypothetical protein